jgi:hypothetical protein
VQEVNEEGTEHALSYRDKFDTNIPCGLVIFDRRSEDKNYLGNNG